MSELEIPEAAYEAARRTGAIGYSDAILAAAPLIVATELRRLAAEWLEEARKATGGFSSRNYAAIKIATNKLIGRADELDPEERTQ